MGRLSLYVVMEHPSTTTNTITGKELATASFRQSVSCWPSPGETPGAPIRGLPRAWTALTLSGPSGRATGPRREGLM